MKQSIALAALVATTLTVAVAPVMAQGSANPVANKSDRQVHRIDRQGGIGPGASFLNLTCSPRAAEELEVALVRLSHRLSLTAEQTTLFDTFRTSALTNQTSFADACTEALADRSADAEPDLLARLKSRLALEESRLAALTAVLPDFEAFYASLTDAQKADLMPRRWLRHDDRDGHGRHDGGDRSHRAPAPGR
ncbi:MAG: hypothetical protein EOP22_13205 [Hyphomicrobiales bacterium]|nr:MAG: hypothetical protein EOP22_13205 [Hyphomicrobiales bacterium]